MRHLLAIPAFLLVLPPAPPAACPFCAPSLTLPSLQRQLDGSDHALLAETATKSTARVTVVLKSAGGFAAGATIDAGEDAELTPGTTWLVLCAEGRPKPRFMRLTKNAADFAVKFAALPPVGPEDFAAQVQHLAFFLAEFGNRDLIVAASVSDAFSKAPYAVVKGLRPRLDGAQLANWLETCQPQHRGILYLLLGIEGSMKARETIRQEICSDAAGEQMGYDGLLGALLLVDGEDGLKAALSSRPSMTAATGRRILYAQNLLTALQFHVESESVIPAAKLVDAAHTLFDDPYAAGPAIGFLIAIKHWGSLDRVLDLRSRWAAERPSIDRATRRFLIGCDSPKAKQVLESIEREQSPAGRDRRGGDR